MFLLWLANEKYFLTSCNASFSASAVVICFCFNFYLPILRKNFFKFFYTRVATIIVADQPTRNFFRKLKKFFKRCNHISFLIKATEPLWFVSFYSIDKFFVLPILCISFKQVIKALI